MVLSANWSWMRPRAPVLMMSPRNTGLLRAGALDTPAGLTITASPRTAITEPMVSAAAAGAAAAAAGTGSAPGAVADPAVVQAEACPAGMFLDDGACVQLPQDESWGEDPVGAPEGEARWNGHFDRRGQWQPYEQIPRRPDRPADYDAYVYPIEAGLPIAPGTGVAAAQAALVAAEAN